MRSGTDITSDLDLPPDLRTATPRILVVEDEMTVAMLIEDMVNELSFEIAGVVPRLEDAMRLADSDDFDVAMLDVHLNGRNVFDFADKLTAEDVPFIFATGYGERGIPERHRGCHVLQKPFAPEDLRRALEKIAASARKTSAA